MTPYSERVVNIETDSCQIYVLPTTAADIVTFKGAFRSLPDMRTNDDLLQDLVVSVLDKGTTQRDQYEIAELLDSLGAQISFFSDGLRVGFRGRALSKDIDTVVALVAEQLREPALDGAEIDKARTRLIASARRSLESTADQASSALRRSVFPHDHPNYSMQPEELIRYFESVDTDQVRVFHGSHFGARGFNAVFVGDLDPDAAASSIPAAFGSWHADDREQRFSTDHLPAAGGLSFVSMPDKPNADVSFGHGLDLRRDDPRFIPLYIANYVLGGNFSARLMARVRDELGLTYGIRSNISSVDIEYDGLWEIAVTLSTENLERGIEATRTELDRFVESGITSDELEEKKTTITGSFKVGLATTAGLAQSLLSNIERGFGPGYLDLFPVEVESCTLEDANGAIRELLHPDKLHLAVAGARSPEIVSETG